MPLDQMKQANGIASNVAKSARAVNEAFYGENKEQYTPEGQLDLSNRLKIAIGMLMEMEISTNQTLECLNGNGNPAEELVSPYCIMDAMLVLERRLDVVSHNIAKINLLVR